MNYVERENQQFKSMLQNYLARVGCGNFNSPTVLDVACGKCIEAEVLFELFGNNIIGIDNDQEEINALLQRIGPDRGRFFTGDVTDLTQILDKEAEIVIARHPNVGSDDWSTIYKKCYGVTKLGGVLISTYYSNLDHALGDPMVEEAGYKIQVSERNPNGIIYSDREIIQMGPDMFVGIGIRPELY